MDPSESSRPLKRHSALGKGLARTLVTVLCQMLIPYFSSLRCLIELLANLSTICLSDLGTLSVLPRPSAEDLGSAVYSSCVKLIRHIASQAQPYVTSHSQDQNNPKEVLC